MKFFITIGIILFGFLGFAQEDNSNYKTKRIAVTDSIQIDSVSINPSFFKIYDLNKKEIDTSQYEIDFKTSKLYFKNTPQLDSITLEYLAYPDFVTRKYFLFNEDDIVNRSKASERLYQLKQSSRQRSVIPFDGLETSGSISRGVTVGNNQNAVLKSELDLQITGKLSDKVSLRASIQDANIPIQEAGYSQRLDEFDQIFIEIFSKNWNIRAGDVNLSDQSSYFGRFNKKVQGISLAATLDKDKSDTRFFGSGALVRGQFAQSRFQGQEGNQGPYKLVGPNGELFVLVVSGSETVYVNGIPLKRGENNDYIIDYNAGEIIFNSTYPITSEMRITVEYQFSDRNYSRILGFAGSNYETEKFSLGGFFYSENDLKNQPLQQNLSEEQIDILELAGDDTNLMTAPSAVADTFDENKILYRKEMIGGVEAFVFSTDPNDALFQVSFTNVGANQGNYILSNTTAISRIYEYVPPLAGVPQGEYEPIIQLVAPTKLQVAVINGRYEPSKNTKINFEAAGSKKDLNLFSALDDGDNDGFAGKVVANQTLFEKEEGWKTSLVVDTDFVNRNFNTIERLYNVEFSRDWNLENPSGNQLISSTGVQAQHPKKGQVEYSFEHLNYSDNYNGNRHVIAANLNLNKFNFFTQNSFLKSNSNTSTSSFNRAFVRGVYGMKKSWVGSKFALEDNQRQDKTTLEFSDISQKFSSYEAFVGVGDSTQVFVEMGYRRRLNDSLVNNQITRVNTSNNYYLKSKLVNSKNSLLSIYGNYRTLTPETDTLEIEQSLNSRLIYNQKLFKQVVALSTVYETNSGTLPQQEFTYVEVDEGQGVYTWNDYNNNGIQELEEFEIAPFPDQATFIRVLLPNQIFLKTHQNKLSQTLTLNPYNWQSETGSLKKFVSHFYNQSSYLIDKKIRRETNSFDLNPFGESNDVLGLNSNFKNTFFFNRGKQRYTTSYTYLSNQSKNSFTSGFQENKLRSHQINFNHKFLNSWLITMLGTTEQRESISENFTSKNYLIEGYLLNPKLSYLLDKNKRFDVFYEYNFKENVSSMLEALDQQRIGASFTINNQQKLALTGEFNYYVNEFTGDIGLPVSYQMLEGLQPGKNYTWSLFVQKKLTKFLDLNLNYFGRKSETSQIIHTGNIQLKAFF
ncbi:MAG: hypothetical protein HRT68_06405 [Flavobacteriaceae bacterium]|nr:hypothetical protein [Flavobacteriaceae bacterium]